MTVLSPDRAAPRTAVPVAGVAKGLVADSELYANGLAENLAALIVNLSGDYGYILAPATTGGKNVMPRVAALLDVAQISDITAVESADISCARSTLATPWRPCSHPTSPRP